MRISPALPSPNCDPPDTTLWVRTAAASATLTVKACHGSKASVREGGGGFRRSAWAQPVLAGNLVDTREFPFVVGDQGVTERDDLRGDQQIVAADRLAKLFQSGAKHSIHTIGWGLEGQDFDGPEHCRELSRKSRRSPFCRSITQFSGDDDAGADRGLANFMDVLRYDALCAFTARPDREASRGSAERTPRVAQGLPEPAAAISTSSVR